MKWNSNNKIARVLLRDKMKCHYCLCELDEKNIHIDHKKPKSKWWTNVEENLCASCQTCNLMKWTKDYEFFKEVIQYFLDGLCNKNEIIEYHNFLSLKSKFEDEVCFWWNDC